MPIFNFYRFENKQVDNEPSFFAAEEAAEARFNQGKYQSPRECFGSFFTSKQRHQLSIMKSHVVLEHIIMNYTTAMLLFLHAKM